VSRSSAGHDNFFGSDLPESDLDLKDVNQVLPQI